MTDLSVGLRFLVETVPTDRLRFLTSERRGAYAAILWLLLRHRRSHEIEVYYDDLLAVALEAVPGVEAGQYDPDAFRADLKQLEEWGNIIRRLEPRRIETLADRSLQKFLCRLDDDTVAVLEFLEARSRASAAILPDRGRHLLSDATERLREAHQLARTLAREAAATGDATQGMGAEKFLRLSYLCFEVDRKVDDAARELVAFHAALIGFATNPFHLQALAGVVERLDRYVEEYVAEATRRARTLYGVARRLLRPPLSDVLAQSQAHAERRRRDDPLVGASPGPIRDTRELIVQLVPFFAPAGRFEILLERVHAAARAVVGRVHRHVENVRARNIRIETLRDRSREMAHLLDTHLGAAGAWVNALFASAHLVSDLRCGTPDARAPLPRPARRYESPRVPYRGGYLAEKRGSPGQSRALMLARLLAIGRFVDAKILRGAPLATLSSTNFSTVEDFRLLLDAVKAHDLRSGRARRALSYGLARPARAGARARFSLPLGTLDAPDLIFNQSTDGTRNG